MQCSRRGSRPGFSFLEVVVALMVFCTIVVALTSLWVVHAQAVGKARNHMMASFLAEQTLENCIAAGFGEVDTHANKNPLGDPVPVTITTRGAEHDITFRVFVTVTEINPDLKWVRVRVTYVERNATREVHYETYMSKAI